jgi:hypothetical protein
MSKTIEIRERNQKGQFLYTINSPDHDEQFDELTGFTIDIDGEELLWEAGVGRVDIDADMFFHIGVCDGDAAGRHAVVTVAYEPECDHPTIELVKQGEWMVNHYYDMYRCIECGEQIDHVFTDDGEGGWRDQHGNDFDISGRELM